MTGARQSDETGALAAAEQCPGCGHPKSKHYALGALGCHVLGCGCARLASGEVTHGVHVYDGRWIAFCQYHGLCASAPLEGFVRSAWARHLAQGCLVAMVERRASTLKDAEGNLTGYVIPVEMWREFRAALERPARIYSPAPQSIEGAFRRAFTPPADLSVPLSTPPEQARP